MPLTEGEVLPFAAGARDSAARAELVDGAAGDGVVLVVGSEPPHGRDLDLLVPDGALAALERRLAAAGFERREPDDLPAVPRLERHGSEWARFAGPRVELVDLVPAASWGLSAPVLEALIAGAEPIAPYRRLRRPAPADALLILARRRLGVHAPLAGKHRRRIAAIEARDAAAWEAAAASAASWGVTDALAALRAAHTGGAASLRLCARAAMEAARGGRFGWPGALVAATRMGALAAGAPSRRSGAVVALSGIDGAGKSTQAAGLVLALEDLGHAATVEWSRLTYDPALRLIGGAPKRVLRLLARRSAGDDPEGSEPGTAAAAALRERSVVVDHLWSLIVVLVHARGQRRALRAHLRAGRVVVRDRYVLDATVQLIETYGRRRDMRLQAWVLRRACPAPALAFWLDADPAEAYRRKPEEYSEAELAGHRRRYQALHAALGVERVDAARAPDVVASDLARAAWLALA